MSNEDNSQLPPKKKRQRHSDNWGGARPNSGRKHGDRTVHLNIMISPEAAARLKAYKGNKTKLIDEWLRQLPVGGKEV